MARQTVQEWGEGARWDNDRELQITKYYGKARDIFNLGAKLCEGEPGVCERIWQRYDEFPIKERSDMW